MRSFIALPSAWKGPAVLILAAALFCQSLPLALVPVTSGNGSVSVVETSVSVFNICDGEIGGGTAGQAERLCTAPPSAAAPSSVRFLHTESHDSHTHVVSSRLFRPPRS